MARAHLLEGWRGFPMMWFVQKKSTCRLQIYLRRERPRRIAPYKAEIGFLSVHTAQPGWPRGC